MNPPTDRERPALSEAPSIHDEAHLRYDKMTMRIAFIAGAKWARETSPKPALDDINWKAEWEATSLLRIADAHVIERLKAGLTQIAARRVGSASNIARITLAAVETGNG